MTGGVDADTYYLSSVEVFSTKTSCSLPSLPERISGHSQTGLTQCGGEGSERSCHQFGLTGPLAGSWSKTHSLTEERDQHIAWETNSDLVLMGGYSSPETTEKITAEGLKEGFALKYEIRY